MLRTHIGTYASLPFVAWVPFLIVHFLLHRKNTMILIAESFLQTVGIGRTVVIAIVAVTVVIIMVLALNRLLNRQSEKIDPSATDEVDRKSPYFKKGSTPTSIQDIVHDRRSGKRWNS
jgi:hypothetical protein